MTIQAQRQKELDAMYELKGKLLPAGEYYYEFWSLERIRKNCPIHKWDELYAPVYGGDFYTNSAKAQYFQSKMAALQAGQKCTCYSEQAKRCYSNIIRMKKEVDLTPLLEDGVIGKIQTMLDARDFKITKDERFKLRLLTIERDTSFESVLQWLKERREFDK